MQVEVAKLEVGQVLRAAFDEPLDSQHPEVVFDRSVVGDVEVARRARTLHLRARVATTAPMVCSRCLARYRHQFALSLEEAFAVVAPREPAGGELGPEDFVLPLGLDLVLDVGEVIRQHLLLAVPMVPLCAPACRGLCPQCGVNRNEQPCACPERSDPRLEQFKALKVEG